MFDNTAIVGVPSSKQVIIGAPLTLSFPDSILNFSLNNAGVTYRSPLNTAHCSTYQPILKVTDGSDVDIDPALVPSPTTRTGYWDITI
jgi:hypothetical protein